MYYCFVPLVLCLALPFTMVDGHGRLIDPPSRSSVWRFPDDELIKPYQSLIEPNYNDNQLFCGGAQYQASRNGQCGVCGDPVDAENPENVPQGKYAKGIIVRQYSEGSTIPVTIEITTHHKGYFEFRLCPWNDVTTPITHECLNEHLLHFANTGLTKYDITKDTGKTGMFHLSIQLPDGITCDQCVIQWRYHTGNTWGCDETGYCDTGVGPQEEFYGCADIAIGTNPIVPPPGFGEDGNMATTSTPSAATSQSTTTTITITTTPSITTTSGIATSTTPGSSNGEDVCHGNANGYVKIDCYSFYRCANGIPYKTQCSAGTMFDETTNTCDFEDKVNCT